ncbi:glycosyltransferase [Aliarcobacter skirrowii]|nr:glycosyltransferase [Aliarcobacter skirrowii]
MLAQLSFWYYRATKVFDNIDYFFVLTNFQKEKVKNLGIDEKKLILKPNSLNMNFNIQKEKKDYIYVGRLEESKGIYELLKVWDTLDERFVLTIIGGGDIEDELKAKYEKKNIIFKGKCSREETLLAISKSKYLIQPSIWYETFGLTIIEAMSFGVPVIGYQIGTRGDFIQDCVNGFLSGRDNLKEVIEKSYKYECYELLSKNAIETAKLYENEYIIEEQIRIYNKILENEI